MPNPRTTQDLRETLFDAIDRVKSGQMDEKTAKTLAVLSAEIIKTAQLELQYSLTVSRLDKQDQGVSPGPLVLTGGAVSNETR